ncbi:MAG: DUF488 family protein [Xanthobacteraceae bacterium]|jgi:uncharacterized protein YeaO (DUF488 family)
MKLHLSTYIYGEPRRRHEGVRIGCARLPVRGVRKAEYVTRNIMDVWLPTVAPSRELLAWALKNGLEEEKTWTTYARRYRREMQETDARQTIAFLALIARHTPIALGCFCRTDHCHRFELERLIREAA